MRQFSVAFLISIAFHILVFAVVFRNRGSKPVPVRETAIELYPEPVVPGGSWPGSGSTANGSGSARRAATRETVIPSAEAVPADGDGSMPWPSGIPVPVPDALVPLRSPFAARAAHPSADTDSLVQQRMQRLFSGMDFSGVGAGPDPAGDWNRKRSGTGDVLRSGSGGKGAAPKEEKNETRFDFLPSENQVQALSVLYQKGKATQKDLYLELDNSVTTTIERFNGELEMLLEKGFVSRKKISPQNLFTIATPFGGFPIEMSGRNRRNPVYEYKALVPRQTLLAFLQSHEFFLAERLRKASPKDTALVRSLLRRCERGMAAAVR